MTTAYLTLIGGFSALIAVVAAIAMVVITLRRDRMGIARAAAQGGAQDTQGFQAQSHHGDVIIRSMSDGVITTDGEGVILDLNPAAARLFGAANTELVGQDIAVILPDPANTSRRGGLVLALAMAQEADRIMPADAGWDPETARTKRGDAAAITPEAGEASSSDVPDNGDAPKAQSPADGVPVSPPTSAVVSPTASAKKRADMVRYGRRADGREVPVSLSVTHVATNPGGMYVVVVRDVTERVAADETESLIRAIDNHLLLGSSTEDICREVCLRLGRLFRLSVVWVGIREPKGRIRVAAVGGEAADQLGLMTEEWVQSGEAPLGPVGVALSTGRSADLVVHGIGLAPGADAGDPSGEVQSALHSVTPSDGGHGAEVKHIPVHLAPGWARPFGAGRIAVLPLWTNQAVAGCLALHIPDLSGGARSMDLPQMDGSPRRSSAAASVVGAMGDVGSGQQSHASADPLAVNTATHVADLADTDAATEIVLRRLNTITTRLGAAFQTIQDQARLRLHSTAMAAAANAILITDVEGRILWVNQAFSRLSGYKESEVIGETPNILKSGMQSDEVYRDLWDSIRGGRPWRGEMIEQRKDGRTYVVDETITPIIDEEGTITHFVAVQEDVTARKKAEERIRYLSNYDTLTRLPNRVLYRDRLYQAVVQSRKLNQGLAVLFIDLDQFSRVNDTLGHGAGDQMLMIIASRILATAEEADTVARLGGDKFALIQPNVRTAEAAATLAAKVVDMINTPVDLGGQEVRVQGNVGIALYPQDGTDPDNLIKNADMAMYRAIRSDEVTYSFFSSEMNAEAAVRLSLEGDLRKALDQNGLSLNYQPQINMRTGLPIGVEALCRWTHPEKGPISPATFIPVAEDSGLIVPLGDWVLEESMRTLAHWRAKGLDDTSMAINISAVQFRREGLLGRVQGLLDEFRLPPHLVELELTESMLLQDARSAVRLLEQLSELGVKLAIDDFGTGYSSLAYLKQFRVDRLKIDQSFIRSLSHGSNDAAIVQAIIGLGHSLGLEIVAEGVETQEQYDHLVSEGCDVVQGYFTARPMAERDAFEHIFDRLDVSEAGQSQSASQVPPEPPMVAGPPRA